MIPTEQKQDRTFRCESCQQTFPDFRTYVDHFKFHEQPLVDIPKVDQKKKGFGLFGRKQQPKQEAKEMQKAPDTLPPLQQIPTHSIQMDNVMERLDKLSMNIAKMMEMQIQTENKQPETPVATEPVRKVKIIFLIPESRAGDFLKQLQEEGSVEIEEISIHKKDE